MFHVTVFFNPIDVDTCSALIMNPTDTEIIAKDLELLITSQFTLLNILLYLRLCLDHWKVHGAKKRFSITSNLRYMYGVLNVDKIKN
jgi:hypothetical protein